LSRALNRNARIVFLDQRVAHIDPENLVDPVKLRGAQLAERVIIDRLFA